MYVWFGFWAAVAVLEAFIYAIGTSRLGKNVFLRYMAVLSVTVAIIFAHIGLLSYDWTLWWVPMLLLPYRLINIARYARYRMPAPRLRAVTLRTHSWVVTAQVILALSSWLLRDVSVTVLFGVIASLQFVGVLALLRASIRTWEHAKPAEITKHYNDADLPSLSVLVPARDETDALQRCLESLIANDYPKLEILVLDDCSVGKKTPEIIRSYAQNGVRFVQGEIPPDNWVAKNFAYEQLRHEASGEILIFCGVDTLFESSALRAIVETLLSNNKMMSVLPTRSSGVMIVSFLQTMRYYWELCLPRRMFKRPPVLSTCWVVRSAVIDELGGFASVTQSVSPEAHFARLAVAKDMYTFVRTNATLQIHSTKTFRDQFDTTVRMRYPQLHRRLELVAATTLFELVFFIGPFLGLPLSFLLPDTGAFFALWFGSVLAVEVMYFLIAVQTKLNSPLVALLTAPFGFVADIVMLHVSMLRYEFGTVNWKGRNVCIPVMNVIPKLPKISE
ncbi:glycosyltransferase family 2 protein [Candidatus Saccharibacteria bacterium]|nr:MAG: glycosyltransferase family 2 protein [Candidatus Saccharibacteria bacterium]